MAVHESRSSFSAGSGSIERIGTYSVDFRPSHSTTALALALRVRGTQGLRVVDASVMPSLPQAMVNAANIAIAERAADLILGQK